MPATGNAVRLHRHVLACRGYAARLKTELHQFRHMTDADTIEELDAIIATIERLGPQAEWLLNRLSNQFPSAEPKTTYQPRKDHVSKPGHARSYTV